MKLLSGIRFLPGKGFKKYIAVLPDGKRVSFGDRRYQHYKDSVPRQLGGGLWSHLDHRDSRRRKAYRLRHSAVKTQGTRAIDVRYSPAWFSYHLLW